MDSWPPLERCDPYIGEDTPYYRYTPTMAYGGHDSQTYRRIVEVDRLGGQLATRRCVDTVPVSIYSKGSIEHRSSLHSSCSAPVHLGQ